MANEKSDSFTHIINYTTTLPFSPVDQSIFPNLTALLLLLLLTFSFLIHCAFTCSKVHYVIIRLVLLELHLRQKSQRTNYPRNAYGWRYVTFVGAPNCRAATTM